MCRGCHVDIVPCTGDVLTSGSIYFGFFLSFVPAFVGPLLLGNVINASFVFVNLNIGNAVSYLLVKICLFPVHVSYLSDEVLCDSIHMLRHWCCYTKFDELRTSGCNAM